MDTEEITMYQCEDGTRFDEKEKARNYDDICQRIKQIMIPMGERTVDCEKGYEYINHNPIVVKNTLSKFLFECSKILTCHSKDLVECANGIRHISQAEYFISESNITVLMYAMFRFSCTNMESGREYQQPYFKTHEEEFLEQQKKYKI